MKKALKVFLLIFAFVVLIISISSITAQEDLSDFEIIVTVTAKGVEMKSNHGCAWEKLSFSKAGGTPYSFKLDEHGVSGID